MWVAALLERLIGDSEERNLDAPGQCLSENEGSLALHRSCGFREVGSRRKIGKWTAPGATLGYWSDVAGASALADLGGLSDARFGWKYL